MEVHLIELYNDIIDNGRVVLLDCEFELDGCIVFYMFSNLTNYINVSLKLKHFYDVDDNYPTIYSLKCEKNINKFAKIIGNMKKMVEGGVVVKNELRLKKEYEKKINYCKLLNITLDKCWVCYEDILNHEHLKCGHRIHTKCAEQYFKINGSFKCGICRETYGEQMYFERKPNTSMMMDVGEDDDDSDYTEEREIETDDEYTNDDSGTEPYESNDDNEMHGDMNVGNDL